MWIYRIVPLSFYPSPFSYMGTFVIPRFYCDIALIIPLPSRMQFDPCPHLAMLHAPIVGKMMTDDPFTTYDFYIGEPKKIYLNTY
jgi:hypothetical protein